MHVTPIDVSRNQLTGPIPSLSGLTQLGSVFASSNQFTGPIPSLSGLTALRYFYVDVNQLTGSIPSMTGLSLQVFVYRRGSRQPAQFTSTRRTEGARC